ncbi:Fic family protein [Tardiphaga sp. 20_F10_N6_6]|uniref:Fic family protein n=1 Tax=Tardiphaga sp. 20_F10_N6_6 TaxID=3240788 RepID=UPI003F89EC91
MVLRCSWHVPPRSETVSDGIEALFQLLETEREASVRAVLGHWLVGHVHPYPDGNGRVARFLMNVMLTHHTMASAKRATLAELTGQRPEELRGAGCCHRLPRQRSHPSCRSP